MWCLKKLEGVEWFSFPDAGTHVVDPIELQILNKVDALHVNETLIKPLKNKPQP